MIPPNVLVAPDAGGAAGFGASAARALIPRTTLSRSRLSLVEVAKRGFRWAIRGPRFSFVARRVLRKGRALVIPWASWGREGCAVAGVSGTGRAVMDVAM